VVAGNYIGTDVTGTAALPNRGNGVTVWAGSSNRIGTDADGVGDTAERNLISGNTGAGVQLTTSDNVVAGNYVGTNVTGTAALPNLGSGVIVSCGSGNIDGTNGDGVGDTAERNVISGNAGSSIFILGSGTNNNVVAGNYLGTSADGTVAVANGGGVYISGGTQSNRVERNLISGNNWDGVTLNDPGTSLNVVADNYIGTDVKGTAAIPNAAPAWPSTPGPRRTSSNGTSSPATRSGVSLSGPRTITS